MSPDGRFLVWPVVDANVKFPDPLQPNMIHNGSRIHLYDIAADKLVDRFPGFKGDAHDLTFTHDGKKLVTVDHRDGIVRIWNVEAGKEERSFRAVPIGVLELIGTAEAKAVLQALAKGAPGASVTRAAKEALDRMRN